MGLKAEPAGKVIFTSSNLGFTNFATMIASGTTQLQSYQSGRGGMSMIIGSP